jgi:putative transposase
MEAEIDEVVGAKGRHIPDRSAVRHGHDGGEVTLGGRRVPVNRPRARTADGEHEVELQTYTHFAARDQLSDVMLERMLAGVSTRRYARTGEPVGVEIDAIGRSTSKSAVSREFVSRTECVGQHGPLSPRGGPQEDSGGLRKQQYSPLLRRIWRPRTAS